MNNPWLIRRPAPGRSLRLYCFAYAGGGPAVYAPWQAALDPAIEVCAIQLPGRGARFGETPWRDMALLVATIAEAIERDSPLPFAFFGHSLGALLAFEVAGYRQRRGWAAPVHLFASGCNAPQRRSPSLDLHLMEDAELIESLREYNGSPPEVLANRELMTLLLPMVRADFLLAETYAYQAREPLDLPLSVLAGRHDEHTTAAQLEGWQLESRQPCRIEWYEGDHFFLNQCREQVIEFVGAQLGLLTASCRA
ncbi:thioesterase II family protein [Duganella violaceipulchra]|uniref:Alpha/beta fold hydrolase n=1 Tax=Duganella violaceipulchra TaxID=2849652 RepID=A0AA41HGB2_9BURK|nr:alpha/beta fold hydrolase [Duganella violaceicalia]MBV6325610.1 alpha/beta fold hydrolase [Duganella violaceicalia]MCP2010923.1 medium-chain acyl-[acyl-carrier-protein] hydrolase [Duganella violaceicalia]